MRRLDRRGGLGFVVGIVVVVVGGRCRVGRRRGRDGVVVVARTWWMCVFVREGGG